MPAPQERDARGPADNEATLLPGEEVAVEVFARVGRRNRSKVKVRIIGDYSYTWVDLSDKWGATIEAAVVNNQQLSHHLSSEYHCPTMTVTQARRLPPHEPWHGLAIATISTPQEISVVGDLFKAWLPGDLLIATHGHRTRSEVKAMIPDHPHFYHMTISKVRHSHLGGATASVWSIIHLSRMMNPVSISKLMTREHYPQPLQASLDDTVGATQEKYLFEPCFGKDYLGTVRVRKTGIMLRVYDADGLAPDMTTISPPRFWFFWVRAASVWSKEEKIIRPIKLHELFAIWDFEGKLSMEGQSLSERMTLLRRRFNSPPGKISRLILHHIFDSKAAQFGPPETTAIGTKQPVKSVDIPFSPMEQAAEVRAEASCPDDAEIDLSVWSWPGESELSASARTVLRRFAVKWWKYYHTRTANGWLKSRASADQVKFDTQAVKDCLFRINACKYFKWVRGSRILYWQLPEEWQSEFRDGIKIWQLPNTVLPEGRMRSIPSETREHELLARDKVFRLRYTQYLEPGVIKLVIPRFTVPKSDDVRVVWDSKANGHNSVLWAPSFILGDFRDLEEITVKWLTMPVASYLLMGSPDEDYSQDADMFIKSWQSDIDVGSQFHNFVAHHQDRPYLGVRMIDTSNDGSI